LACVAVKVFGVQFFVYFIGQLLLQRWRHKVVVHFVHKRLIQRLFSFKGGWALRDFGCDVFDFWIDNFVNDFVVAQASSIRKHALVAWTEPITLASQLIKLNSD
jgi:hypothetical protein